MDTIRIIHNLQRSGGTIISKSVSAQKNIILLSEIHPEGPKIMEKMGAEPKYADPLYQFQSFYKLFDFNELKNLKETKLNFLEKIKTINKKVNDQNKILIIRDWSFVDYFGKPFIEPTKKNILLDILSKDFEIKNIFIIRDPLENYISCCRKLVFFLKNYSFDQFLESYKAYIKSIPRDNHIKFEEFTENPEKTLEKISSKLNFDFDKEYLKNMKNVKITGDKQANSSDNIIKVKKIGNEILNEDQKEKINKNEKYIEIKNILDKFI